MKMMIATATLTILFLSAGAFASNNSPPDRLHGNVTVIQKNQAWPLQGNITVEPCAAVTCYEV